MEPKDETIPFEPLFRSVCLKNGLSISDGELSRLATYAALLIEWNQKVNLISRKDETQIWQNHLLHSISPLFKLKLASRLKILDLGSGGGLPGIPWGILMPKSNLLLLDSTQKKISADAAIVETLRLQNIQTVWGRAEDLGRKPELSQKFNVVVVRAVAPLRDLIAWAKPFLAPGSMQDTLEIYGCGTRSLKYPCLLALKGGDLQNEIAVVRRKTGGPQIETINLAFEGSSNFFLSDKKLVIVEF